jgi:undecaprenyl-diphosphatase
MHGSDLSVLYFFNQTLASPMMDTIMDILTNVHYWYPVYVLGALFLIYRYKWRGVRMVIAALLLVLITDSLDHYLLKPLIGRARPCALLPSGAHIISWIRLPIGMRWDPSFPSSHALNNFAVAALLGVIDPRKKLGRWLYPIAFIISIGRIYEGLHYPSDVVGGGMIGITLGILFAMLFEFIEEKIQHNGPRKETPEMLTAEEIGSVDLAEKEEQSRVWLK